MNVPITQTGVDTKVAAGSLAGAIIVILTALLGAFSIAIPPTLGMAFVVVLQSAFGYFTRSRVPKEMVEVYQSDPELLKVAARIKKQMDMRNEQAQSEFWKEISDKVQREINE